MKPPLIILYAGLIIANLACWLWAVLAFGHAPLLLGTALLAYSFGLRHAVDADHIAAIDNVTRKLLQAGARSDAVGLYFSLGHSTIVVALSAAIACTATAVKLRFPGLESWGNLVGTLISALFLLALGGLNAQIFAGLLRNFRSVRGGSTYDAAAVNLLTGQGGLIGRLLRGIFGLIQHDWQMYLVGILFGLGFDTATEVGLLGISAAEAGKGLHAWSIMIFPALFTAGMALVDTTDSVLMTRTYGWAFTQPLRKLTYNLTVTGLSVVVAVGIGGVETLGLLRSSFALTGPVWDAVGAMNDHFGLLGYLIIALFGLSWAASAAFYKWRGYGGFDAAK